MVITFGSSSCKLSRLASFSLDLDLDLRESLVHTHVRSTSEEVKMSIKASMSQGAQVTLTFCGFSCASGDPAQITVIDDSP